MYFIVKTKSIHAGEQVQQETSNKHDAFETAKQFASKQYKAFVLTATNKHDIIDTERVR